MTPKMTRKPLARRRIALKLKNLRGWLRWREHQVDLKWSIAIDDEGEITVSFAPVKLTRDTAWMLKVLGGNELFGEWAAVSGTSTDGVTVMSEHVHLGSREERDRAGGTFVVLSGEAARVQISRQPLPKTTRGLRLVYGTVGMEGFSVQRVKSPVGRVSVIGSSRITDYNKLIGSVEIAASTRSAPLLRWLDRADLVTERVLEMVSLAEGRIVRWSFRHIVYGRKILTSEFVGPQRTGVPFDGAGHFLNLQPFVELAIRRYTPSLRSRTGFSVALQWFLSHPPYTEQQLLAAMTVLEHLAATYVARYGCPKIVGTRTFRALKTDLTRALNEFANDRQRRHRRTLQQKLQRFHGKISGMNDAPLRDKLAAMLISYRVPLTGIEHLVADAIKTRNRVVHSGIYSSEFDGSERLFEHVMILRELLKRIFLTLLNYKGSYETRFPHGGREIFPPLESPTGARAA